MFCSSLLRAFSLPPAPPTERAASELITAALIQTHQIGFGLCHNKSPQTELVLKQTTGCLCSTVTIAEQS